MARATVRPPTPESKIPIGASVTRRSLRRTRTPQVRSARTCRQGDTVTCGNLTSARYASHPPPVAPHVETRIDTLTAETVPAPDLVRAKVGALPVEPAASRAEGVRNPMRALRLP